MKCLLLLSLFMVVALSDHISDDNEKEWQKFKDQYNKQYKSPEEERYRKSIFMKTLSFVRYHNAKFAKGETTFSVGIDQFADTNLDELPDIILQQMRERMRNIMKQNQPHV